MRRLLFLVIRSGLFYYPLPCGLLSNKQKQPLHWKKNFPMLRLLFLVIRSGFEPETHSLEGCCSIQLSYQTMDFHNK